MQGQGEGAPALQRLGPADVIRLPRDEACRRAWREARDAGETLLRQGKLAAVLLAGGQGTRLGFDGPKGAFPFAPVTRRTLFHHHAAKVAAIRARYGCELPLYVMTSPQNDAETRALFEAEERYGLPEGTLAFFVQGTMPAVDLETGAVLLEARDRLALSPDGHGGLLAALRRAGVLDELRERGIETILTFQVDNPLLRLARPELIGHHALRRAEMSSVVVSKRTPEERMGVVATVDGRTAVVEYSDLPDELANRRAPDGSLELWAGSIAVHCLQRTFVERLTEGGVALPFHRAEKRVAHVTLDGARIEPERPNAVKFETFLFDALPLAERTATVESERSEEFSPIKNASGADSPETARRDLNRLYGRWLSEAGVAVPCDVEGDPIVDIEIDPRLALDAEELAERLPPGLDIAGPTVLGPGGR
ncbi:MAG: UDP-N-acetylglucosamine/UDP-N-acetylgalactosamine diphosphorylase [Miltoncostaeaceae bacterium]|nr:UDP-N-acetylglucosamine/UDP-N-acetylgalactosamine diphosphorylase [Miltoncostaeaceae bacterium]